MWFIPKDYVWVHTRVQKAHDKYLEKLSIETTFDIKDKIVFFKAIVSIWKQVFNWSSFWELWKDKAFEKLETVAVWRALAFAWFEIQDWIASKDEMDKFEKNKSYTKEVKKWLNYESFKEIVESWNTTEKQIADIIKEDWYTLSNQAKIAVRNYIDTWIIEKSLFFKK